MPALFLIILIPIAIILLIVGFLISAYVLYLVTNKIFKINKASYKSSLLISLWLGILAIIIELVLYVILRTINLGFLFQLLSFVLGFIIFHYLLQKYYQIKLSKNILIYIVYSIIDAIVVVVVSLLIIIPVRTFIMEPFYISGAAMEPNFVDRDYIILNKFDGNLQRGDIAVFRYPKDPSVFFIKRIIGLPGETVSIANNKVLINNQILDESKYLSSDTLTSDMGQKEIILGTDEYYVLGDNRSSSLDSRRIGPIKRDLITGKYWFTAAKANQ